MRDYKIGQYFDVPKNPEEWKTTDFIKYIRKKWIEKYKCNCDFMNGGRVMGAVKLYLINKLRRKKLSFREIALYIDFIFEKYEIINTRDLFSDFHIAEFLKVREQYNPIKDEEPEIASFKSKECKKEFDADKCRVCNKYEICLENDR